jgi:hypothetical protein
LSVLAVSKVATFLKNRTKWGAVLAKKSPSKGGRGAVKTQADVVRDLDQRITKLGAAVEKALARSSKSYDDELKAWLERSKDAATGDFACAFGVDDGPWLNIRGAIEVMVANQKSLSSAEGRLIVALAAGMVKSRVWIRTTREEPGWFLSLPAEFWNHPDADAANVLDSVRRGTGSSTGIVSIEVNETELRAWLPRCGRRGPVPGQIARYQRADEALFPQLRELMSRFSMSTFGAAKELALKHKIARTGTPENRARRLVKAFRKN